MLELPGERRHDATRGRPARARPGADPRRSARDRADRSRASSVARPGSASSRGTRRASSRPAPRRSAARESRRWRTAAYVARATRWRRTPSARCRAARAGRACGRSVLASWPISSSPRSTIGASKSPPAIRSAAVSSRRRRCANIPAAVRPRTSASKQRERGRDEQAALHESHRRERVASDARNSSTASSPCGTATSAKSPDTSTHAAALDATASPPRAVRSRFRATSRELSPLRESATTASAGGVGAENAKATTRAFVATANSSTLSFQRSVSSGSSSASGAACSSSSSSRASTSCLSSDGTTMR